MKKNLHLKTVQVFVSLLILLNLYAAPLSAQAVGDFGSNPTTLTSGNYLWATVANWVVCATPGTWADATVATGAPGGGKNVWIRSNHTITIGATHSVLNLTIQANGTLNSDLTWGVTATTRTLRVGTSAGGGATDNEAIFQNDGVFGSTTNGGAGDGINFEMSLNAKSLTLQGSGTTKVTRFRCLYPNPNPTATFNVNQNMDLSINNNSAFTGYYNNISNTITENYVVNILANRTVKVVAGGSFHGTSSVPSNPQGTITYNIFGTLDLSATTSCGFITSSNASSTPTLNLSVKSSGVMKTGSVFSVYKGSSAGTINMTIENGGLVDGTALTSGFNNNNSTLGTGYSWFVTQGTGTIKLPVSSTSMTFPIGPNLTSYNPVTLNNGGGNVFAVSVAAVNSPPGIPDVTKAVKRTWGIVPTTFPATADINFGYNTGEGNASCVLTDPMQLQNYPSSAWQALGTATPSVPSSGATSFQVGYSGITSFGFYNLTNLATIPVEMITFKGYAKGNVNMLEWSTATERNNREFAIERSTNGVDFKQIGSVKGNGNASTVNSYSFTDDAAPLSIGYYRLRQIDFDGKETVSKAVTIARNGSGKLGLTKLYPSVTSDYLNIEMTTVGNTSLTITDVMGRVVSTKQLGDSNGSMLQRLDVSNLSNGLYFITLHIGSTSITEKFKKQ